VTDDKTPLILLVDDDELLRSTMASMFEKEGYRVEAAVDGADGVEKALRLHPRLIIMDYQMPILNGIEAMEKIRADPWGATASMIFATNSYDIDVMNTTLRLGVKDYILKNDTSLEGIRDLVTKYVIFQ
jgi:CheY-like chemotaxis protein